MKVIVRGLTTLFVSLFTLAVIVIVVPDAAQAQTVVNCTIANAEAGGETSVILDISALTCAEAGGGAAANFVGRDEGDTAVIINNAGGASDEIIVMRTDNTDVSGDSCNLVNLDPDIQAIAGGAIGARKVCSDSVEADFTITATLVDNVGNTVVVSAGTVNGGGDSD